MRDLLLDSTNFIFNYENILKNASVNFLRSSALDSPNFLEKYDGTLRISTRNVDDYVVLALLSWYLDEEIGILLRLELEKLETNSDLGILRFFLKSKAHSRLFLLDTRLWHTRDFFGNLLTDKRLQRLTKLLTFRRRVLKTPTRIQRKRGYKDKGTLKRQHEVHQLWTGTRKQQMIEEERQSRSDTFAFLQGFLE